MATGVEMPVAVECWDCLEAAWAGPAAGNPFNDV